MKKATLEEIQEEISGLTAQINELNDFMDDQRDKLQDIQKTLDQMLTILAVRK